MTDKTVEAYAAGLGDWRADVVAAMHGIVGEAAPDATAAIKWAQPVWSLNGPFAYAKAFPTTVNIGFWRGVELSDPDGRLIGGGERMRHLRIANPAELDAEVIAGFVREAVALNQSKGDPTRR
ncbi:MAG TPA: DUF1801 domain-containing protein [Candidatus Limnocylindrales bacterium]